MKKLLLIAILMLALVFTVVACTTEKTPEGTTAGETTVAEPADSTAEPDDTTAAPAPEETTAEPAPVETTAAPVETTAEPETTTEVVTADPADPVWIIDADGLAAMTNANAATVEKNEAGYASFTATAGDPWFLVTGSIGEMPEYLAIRYRTNTTQTGEIFIGSGAGPAAGASFTYSYNANSEWNLMVIHLPEVVSSITDGVIGHIRFDFYTGGPEEGAFLDVEYMAFFNTAEYAEAYDFAKHPPYIEADDAAAGKVAHSFDTFFVNGSMYFPEDGGAGDKLTAQNNTVIFGAEDAHDSLALRGWIGFAQTIDSFGYFIDNYTMVYGEFKAATEDGVLAAGGANASRFQIDVPLADLEAGVHMIGFVVKLADGTVVRLRENLKVVIVPAHEDSEIVLAERGPNDGTPICAASDKKLGQRFTVSEGFLKNISVTHMATYSDGNTNTWSFKVWQWNGDYATTVAGTPLFATSGENHADNSNLSIDIPVSLMISGDIYYEAEYLNGSGGFTGWTSTGAQVEGLQSYVAGALKDVNFASSIVVGIAVDEPEAPSNEIAVEITDNNTWIDVVEFTATASGTYTFTLPAGLGAFDVEDCDTWPPVAGPYVDYYDNVDGATFSIDLAEGETTAFYIAHAVKGNYVITYEFVEGEVGGDEPADPEVPADKILNVGENTVAITDAIIAEGGVSYTLTITEEGNYTFMGDLLAIINDADGNMVGRGMAYLVPGTYTINLGTMLVTAAGDYVVNVVLEVPEEAGLEVDTPYYLEGVNAAGALYFAGTVTNGRADGCADTATATMVSLEATDVAGEYYIYFLVDGNKNYLIANENKSAGLAISAEKTDAGIWVIDETAKTIISKTYPNRGLATQIGSNYNNFSFYAVSNFENTAEYKTSWFLAA